MPESLKQILVPDGSVSTTSLGFNGDPDTGLFQPADNQIGVVTAGTERVRFDASGNVGIGATSFGTSAAKVLAIADGTAPSTSPSNVGQLYAESGTLKYRDSSGTITSLAPGGAAGGATAASRLFLRQNYR